MNKIIVTVISVFTLILTPALVSAQGTQNKVQNPSTHTSGTPAVTATGAGNQQQNQNQIATQNKGEETQLQVATQFMQQLMDMEGFDEGVGEKVRTVAQEQVQAQTQIQTQLNKLESKSQLMKKLFGPDFNALNELKSQMEQNQLRIGELQKLQNQISNKSELTQLQTAIQALIEQNTALQDQVNEEEATKSLFGWLIKLFNK